MPERESQCRWCGATIKWIRTRGMKSMPVNPTLIAYREDPRGKERFVTPGGDVIAGSIAYGETFDGAGYISHFATCPASREARSKGRKK